MCEKYLKYRDGLSASCAWKIPFTTFTLQKYLKMYNVKNTEIFNNGKNQ